ncbi:Rossmann-like and DUF2520 domain-containing protein [Acinetobacter nectaris]|uniref:Rossmann-like and DUF2520 domain-containing protein n=1 Tax=Acinetobacter nectaris TaxID=1219382 RepID=UPI001F3D8E47|nr:Rossmann-like and DUF2520 domain-containing protein [Acinetobacter nectaris]MCF8999224.1 DUF2520 domain-containing protein [Acinetobacter nectaris]MCF9026451.1 DUF2520 domain-containing protein [Acinetobacter nectaris]
MRISFIGSGKVATQLATGLFKIGHEVVDIFSPNLQNAQTLADQVLAKPVDSYSLLDQAVELVIIAVKDQAIEQVIQALVACGFVDTCIVHTSGSTHLKVLEKYYRRSGVFYPLQTFSFEKKVDWKTTPIFIEANDHRDMVTLKSVAAEISKEVYLYNSEQRLSLHLAAVFACNFSNYCYDISQQIVEQQGVDFKLLYPLILETANKATHFLPQTVQTGPAVRHDANILALQESLLQKNEQYEFLKVYELMSEQIQKRHDKKD